MPEPTPGVHTRSDSAHAAGTCPEPPPALLAACAGVRPSRVPTDACGAPGFFPRGAMRPPMPRPDGEVAADAAAGGPNAPSKAHGG